MKFKATEDQVKQIMCNAVNAAQPFGMGFLHFEEKDYTSDEFVPIKYSSGKIAYGADYYRGRMVKLEIEQCGEDEWKITRPGYPPNPEYQSWAHQYPTLEALVESVTA